MFRLSILPVFLLSVSLRFINNCFSYHRQEFTGACWRVPALTAVSTTHRYRYTVSQYRPILVILSPLKSKINCWRSWNWIHHLPLTLLPHYLAKITCSVLMLYSRLS